MLMLMVVSRYVEQGTNKGKLGTQGNFGWEQGPQWENLNTPNPTKN